MKPAVARLPSSVHSRWLILSSPPAKTGIPETASGFDDLEGGKRGGWLGHRFPGRRKKGRACNVCDMSCQCSFWFIFNFSSVGVTSISVRAFLFSVSFSLFLSMCISLRVGVGPSTDGREGGGQKGGKQDVCSVRAWDGEINASVPHLPKKLSHVAWFHPFYMIWCDMIMYACMMCSFMEVFHRHGHRLRLTHAFRGRW